MSCNSYKFRRHKGHALEVLRRSMALHMWRDWANLPDGPAGLLAEHVLANDVADYVRFRAVCHPWRRCCTDPRGHYGRRFFPRHWIMLREKLSPSHRRRFLNVSTGECIKVDLPELSDHDTIALTPEGLLVLLHESTHVRLLNPLTRHLTELPPLTTLIPPGMLTCHWNSLRVHFDQHSRACGSGVANDSNVVLYLHSVDILGIAKPGDERWTLVKYESRPLAAIVFLGRFYCVIKNNLMVLETSLNQPPRMEVAAELNNLMVMMIEASLIQRPQMAVAANLHTPLPQFHVSVHLVGCGGELMLVHRKHRMNRSCFDVYRLDLDTGKLLLAKSFNGRALFIGMNVHSSLSVSTDVFPSIVGDAIYLSLGMYNRAVVQIEAYHLADGDTEFSTCNLDSSMSWPHTLVECLVLCHTDRHSRHLTRLI